MTTEFGVYACVLIAVEQALWNHHHHLYVSSGTSAPSMGRSGGIKAKVDDRDNKKLSNSYFNILLRDGKPRGPVLGVLFQIEGSQAEMDEETRTHNRFVTYLVEPLFQALPSSRLDSRSQRSA